jgi:ribonuclease HII
MAVAPARCTVPRDAGIGGFERALRRRGFPFVAGVDEAGRGACAGPLAIAAVVLPAGGRGRVPGLADSKLLPPAVREQVYAEVVDRALAWSVVLVPPGDIDRTGLHVCNVAGMRRAVAALAVRPSYVLTDGFPVRGLGIPTLAIWKGDQVAASIAAASVVAKVTRDRLMVGLHDVHPRYEFASHKGYVTPEHTRALDRHGPCPEHRFSYVNVARAADVNVARAAAPGSLISLVATQPGPRHVGHNEVMAEDRMTRAGWPT